VKIVQEYDFGSRLTQAYVAISTHYFVTGETFFCGKYSQGPKKEFYNSKSVLREVRLRLRKY
jgi:hypothetical protein